MADEVIKELWQIKDEIAEEFGRDIDALVAHLRSRDRPDGQVVVDRSVAPASTGTSPPASS